MFDTISLKSKHINRHLRQAAFIWLFVFLERCSKCHFNCITEQLCNIQDTFVNGLAESDG